ncbi:Smr/MutS family protein [Geoalkalibacter halelectricus]|uniref:Smr/MutS family protein n=1 Tax=Geoalkalibacter halelectricus TaxID=2847045 RepID=A0ABY5ZTR2_9BACT|nr:Smr/MutS family protein [Geoalkalibacter halelectricus]MDO3377023.1 Smr/MutS family protein [Geoalkalibacter halelectricus]UWZ81245.1 Smr/MutS family protein [Geoalkalibacter halelectricus]
MARKKKPTGPAKPNPKDFSHTPFKDLKGVCHFPDGESQKAASTPEPAAEKPVADASEECLFLEEMAMLRVTARPGRDSDDSAQERRAGNPAAEDDLSAGSTAALSDEDEALFLEALGTLDRTFVDAVPEPPTPPQASPRRMRELARGRRRPEAELDLHGLDRLRARERVRHFLDNSRFHGLSTVLVITGRGLHSDEEPVLRSELERFLEEEGRTWAVEWGRAPRRYGGEGALVIFLKNS